MHEQLLKPMQAWGFRLSLLTLLVCQAGQLSAAEKELDPQALSPSQVDKLLVVDCLLPGQVRKLGAMTQYLTPRRPIKTTALQCEIRGGEYVAYDRANFATALKVWLPQAQEGNAEAQTYVGEIYEKGFGVEPDYQLAAMWYRKAADQNFSRAQINLGFLYERGLGVEQNLSEAMNWYRQASGLTDGTLEYVSTVEIANRAQQAEELAALRSENETLTAQAQQFKSQLNSVQAKLSTAQAEKNKLAAEFDNLQQRKKQLDQQLNASDKERKQLELALQQNQQQINSQDSAVSSLQKEKDLLNSRLSNVQQQRDQVAMGPSISIASPLLAATRGIPTVKLRSIEKTTTVSGMVNAPAGIKAFSVNGELERISKDGRFDVQIPLKTAESKINIKAIDSKGREAEVEFLVKKMEVAEPSNAASGGDKSKPGLGNYHAVIIGNNQYQHLTGLDTAINDAKRVDKVLRDKYAFKTTLLLNADRRTILATLYQLRERLGEQDNLVIYYAGHGDMDKVNNRGYWLPVDAEENNPANWISNEAVSDVLNTLPAKHIMLVVDSCYSGTMSRTAMPQIDVNLSAEMRNQWLKLMNKRKSRTVLTSGGLQPVLDDGGNGSSIFAQAFVTALQSNKELLVGYNLYRAVIDQVSSRSAKMGIKQVPEYAPIKHSGHETGQFVFLPAS